jgi:hypothetical protein
METMEALLSIMVGVGLSAACGFRVFVPLLVVSVAQASGHLHLSEGFAWMGSPVAVTAFGVATVLEVAAYYIPGLDHFLDTVTTPAAVVAGTVITASFVHDVSPFMKWSMAAIAGGGAAGTVQVATVLTRGLSLATSGGLANPLVSTAELGGSLATSLMALFLPLVAVLLLCGLVAGTGYAGMRYRSSARQPHLPPSSPQPPRLDIAENQLLPPARG